MKSKKDKLFYKLRMPIYKSNKLNHLLFDVSWHTFKFDVYPSLWENTLSNWDIDRLERLSVLLEKEAQCQLNTKQ